MSDKELDLDAIEADVRRHALGPYEANRWHVPKLLDEVRRLRAELAAGAQQAAAEERARIVAWIRTEAIVHDYVARLIADTIECGGHEADL